MQDCMHAYYKKLFSSWKSNFFHHFLQSTEIFIASKSYKCRFSVKPLLLCKLRYEVIDWKKKLQLRTRFSDQAFQICITSSSRWRRRSKSCSRICWSRLCSISITPFFNKRLFNFPWVSFCFGTHLFRDVNTFRWFLQIWN